MKKEEVWMIISFIGVVLSVILAWAMPHLWMRLIFIFCAVAVATFLYMARKSGNKGYLSGVVISIIGMGGMLMISFVSVGSPAAYMRNVALLFQNGNPEQEAMQNELLEVREILNDTTDIMFLENQAELQRISDIDNQISDMNTEMQDILADLEEQQYWKEKKDPEQIELIFRKIEEEYKRKEASFSTLKTDKDTVELFYKMFLSEMPYFYCNIISAMDAYGIDCEKFSIDERMLVVWDTEMLFINYSILDSIGKDAAEDRVYESNAVVDEKPVRKYVYNQYRLLDRNRYSDTLNYGNWYWYSWDLSAQSISSQLDNKIMKYYKKFSMNFQ